MIVLGVSLIYRNVEDVYIKMSNFKLKNELTPREIEVMSYVVKGMSNPQIADKLFITKHTVKAHVSSALYKLNVKSRWAAAMIMLNMKNDKNNNL